MTCRLCPDFASNQTATKREADIDFIAGRLFFICQIAILHLCPSGHLCSVATFVSCLSLASVFAYLTYDV